MFDLSNVTALVTGATGGIGRAIIKDLVELGASKVIAIGRNEVKLNQIKIDFQEKIETISCDFRDDQQVNELLKKIENNLNSINVLVCNAGITRDNLLIKLQDKDWNDVININLTTTFKINRAAVKAMIKQKYGRIINIASVIGMIGNAGQTNYAASKGGIIALSKSLAKEVASRGITVNCIAPGYINTPMTEGLNDDIKSKIIKSIPAAKIGRPEDVSSAVAFLASRESAYITGHTLNINGGMFMY